MPEENGTKVTPPYLPHSSFKKFLESLKAGKIPSRIDKSLLLGMSGSMQSWIISSLRFFDLIYENGTPTERLKELVDSEGEEKKKKWRETLERAYGPIIEGLDLERATMLQLEERFKGKLTGETVRKSISFFTAAAESVGIPLADHLKPKDRSSGPRRIKRNRQASKGAEPEGGEEDEPLKPGVAKATLLLDAKGDRSIKIEGPSTISPAELDRIQKWISFHFIVEAKSDVDLNFAVNKERSP